MISLLAVILFHLGSATKTLPNKTLIMGWAEWRQEFEPSRPYVALLPEEERELQFNKNIAKIKAHNELYVAGEVGYYFGVNAFTDLSTEEFMKAVGMLTADQIPERKTPVNPTVLDEAGAPSSIDWRDQGAVTPIKNQGQCGSCWSFSSTGAMEGNLFIRTGQLISLSEQELVDCDTQSFGCNGGLMEFAFEFVIQNGGIDTESDYPYYAEQQYCDSRKTQTDAASFSGYKDVTPNSAPQLMAAAAQAPIAVSLDAQPDIFQYYSGGVIDNPSCGVVGTHAVLVVGYTERDDEEYPFAWTVKNSWGEQWGVDGYFYVTRNVGYHPEGMCGILNGPSYPTGGQTLDQKHVTA